MARKLLHGAVCGLFAMAFACGTLMAQNRIQDFVRIEPSLDITPYHASDVGASTVVLFSNLGPTATDAYDDAFGYCVTGNNQSSCGSAEQWIAQPFTPKAASHATGIEAAIQYYAGTNALQLSLYNDVSGAPGTSLKTVEVHNAPTAGTCCTLVAASLGSPGVALTAATQYWVVASADDTHAPTFSGYWGTVNSFIAYNPAQAGWTAFNDPEGSEAAVVKGTIP
jgi:hypothetical protein